MPAHLTKFTSTFGAPPRLCKHLERDGDTIRATPAAQLVEGSAERVAITSLHELGELLDSLQSSQALAYGVTDREAVKVLSAARLKTYLGNAPAIARTRENFPFHAGPGVLFLDHDAPSDGGFAPDDLVNAIRAAVPELDAHPILWRPSASSCIYDATTGAELRGVRGQHLYIVAPRARDIPSLGAAIVNRLWLTGHGRCVVAKSGAVLYRTLVDESVFQGERLDFARADCGPGLVQRMHPFKVYDAVDLFGNTDELQIPITAQDLAEVQTRKAHAAAAVAEQASAAKAEHVRELAREQLPKGATQGQITARAELIGANLDADILSPDHRLILQSGEVVSVADVLSDLPRFDGVKCADPIEPRYGDGKTVAFIKCVFHAMADTIPC